MTRGTAIVRSGDRRIGSWRIVGGALIHFVVPVYLIGVPVACLLAAPAGASWGAIASNIPAFSAWFLGGYTLFALAATTGAAALDVLFGWRRRHREARDPRFAALASERRVARALSDARRTLGERALPLLDALRGPRWDHADDRYQALSLDLERVVATSLAALASAAPERRTEIVGLATDSLARIEGALDELHAERGALDEGDVRTVARYIESRYRPSDFTGDST